MDGALGKIFAYYNRVHSYLPEPNSDLRPKNSIYEVHFLSKSDMSTLVSAFTILLQEPYWAKVGVESNKSITLFSQ